jgi:hypothetical protein
LSKHTGLTEDNNSTGNGIPRREELGDFTTTWRVLPISLLAMAIGVLCAYVALVLLRLIGLFTNLFYFGRWSTAMLSPAGNHLGIFSVLVPVGGALIIGLMARYGSERIRGHGIPEAIEAILMNGSRVQPKVAILKPLSSAISIGSGGPFGAEGPIIMTGGAFGSMIAQLFHLTGAERKTLLVAGAAGGMSATFASPVAAVLLAVELLLFEWKPRSLIPVALGSAVAAVVRRYILGFGPLFPVPEHPPAGGQRDRAWIHGSHSETNVLEVYPDETPRLLVYQMAESGITRMPVVERGTGKLLGIVTLDHLLKARTRHLEEERRRERILTWRFFTGRRPESVEADS